MYHGYASPDAHPYVEFQIYGGNLIWYPGLPPKQPGNDTYDYAAVYDYYNLCSLVQSGDIDEVWFWDAGQGGFTEYVTTGPQGTWSTGGQANPPNCGKQVTTMTFNYTREIDVHMEACAHRLEGLFMHYFPCDFWTDTWPWQWWPSQCAGLVSDVYGFVARPFSGNSYVGGCGDAHCPPNILDEHAYDYSNHTVVQSICEDWQQDGTATIKSFDCQEWGCNHAGYHVWWMQNIPGLNNTNRNRNGNLHPNWWTYLFGEPAALGDANEDGLVNSTDALIVLSADVGMNTSSYCPMNCGDVNADGLVNSTDALVALSYDAGMSVPFRVGQPGCPSSVTQPPGCSPFGGSPFQVLADQGWQDSDIALAQGQQFQVKYISGTGTDYSGGTAPFGPEGGGYICGYVGCCEPLFTVAKGALIGKVGNEVFLIGNGGVFVTGVNGNLLVRMNDCDSDLADNAGSVYIKITP